MSLRERIRGVLGFPVTPFRKDLSLDLDTLAGNVDEMARYSFCISNIAPRLSIQLAEAGMAHDVARLNGLMEKYVHPLYAMRERVKGYEVSAMKAAMEILGKPAGPVRPPLTNCVAQDIADLRALMEVYADVLDRKSASVAG